MIKLLLQDGETIMTEIILKSVFETKNNASDHKS